MQNTFRNVNVRIVCVSLSILLFVAFCTRTCGCVSVYAALVNSVRVFCPFETKIGLILFIGGVNYAILTTALLCTMLMLTLYICIYCSDVTVLTLTTFTQISLFVSLSPSLSLFLSLPLSFNVANAVNILDNFVDNELYLGFREFFNTTHKDCVWHNTFKDRKLCTKDAKIWLYSNGTKNW